MVLTLGLTRARIVSPGGTAFTWIRCKDVVPPRTDVGAGNGDLGLKSEANECRRSATKNLKSVPFGTSLLLVRT